MRIKLLIKNEHIRIVLKSDETYFWKRHWGRGVAVNKRERVEMMYNFWWREPLIFTVIKGYNAFYSFYHEPVVMQIWPILQKLS